MQTEHKGYKITYVEHLDEWHCNDLQVAHTKLSTLKAKISKTLLADLKAEAVVAYYLDTSGHQSGKPFGGLIPITISSLINITGCGHFKHNRDIGCKVRYSVVKHGSNRATHINSDISNLCPNSSRVRDAVNYAVAKEKIAKLATKQANEAWAAVPRLKEGGIQAIVDLYNKTKEKE